MNNLSDGTLSFAFAEKRNNLANFPENNCSLIQNDENAAHFFWETKNKNKKHTTNWDCDTNESTEEEQKN